MFSSKYLLLVVLTFLFTCNAQKANLVVLKSLVSKDAVLNKDLLVNLKIFNVGDGTAYDVRVDDTESWPSDKFSAGLGLLTATWDKIPAGGNVSHTFSVIPLENGYQETKRATVQYKESARGKENYGFSTDLGAIFVSRYSEFDKKSAPHLKEWSVFGLLSSVVIVPFYYYWSKLARENSRFVKKRS